LALAICALAFGAVSNAQKGGSTMNVAKIKKTLDKENDPTKCKGPRPADRGCKIYCKPRQVAVCEAGKWKYERIEYLDGECDPKPSLDGGSFCIVEPGSGCPAGCQKCFPK
jgi:hypothetical protein